MGQRGLLKPRHTGAIATSAPRRSSRFRSSAAAESAQRQPARASPVLAGLWDLVTVGLLLERAASGSDQTSFRNPSRRRPRGMRGFVGAVRQSVHERRRHRVDRGRRLHPSPLRARLHDRHPGGSPRDLRVTGVRRLCKGSRFVCRDGPAEALLKPQARAFQPLHRQPVLAARRRFRRRTRSTRRERLPRRDRQPTPRLWTVVSACGSSGTPSPSRRRGGTVWRMSARRGARPEADRCGSRPPDPTAGQTSASLLLESEQSAATLLLLALPGDLDAQCPRKYLGAPCETALPRGP